VNIKFVHVNLISHSYKALASFYINVFGCREEPPVRDLKGEWVDNLTSLNNTHIRGIHLLLPGYEKEGPTLEIFQYNETLEDQNKAVNKEGFGHIAFAVEDVKGSVEKLLKYGGSLVGEIVDAYVEGVGTINVAYCKDPEGNIIEIQRWA